jgi:hypothetical protein
MYGNVRKLVDRPMLEVIDSTDIAVSQLKAFRPGPFPHVREINGQEKSEVPSSRICALFVRNEQGGSPQKVPPEAVDDKNGQFLR